MGLIILLLSGCLIIINKKIDTIEKYVKEKGDANSFNLKLLKEVNKDNHQNYLISPYSIEIALSMVKDGATGTTHKEIAEVLPSRTIKNLNVKDRISTANALFIKNEYANSIKKTFINDIKSKYEGEVIYDDFVTPVAINNWVDDKTYHMIDKILDNISDDFMLGLANALAIDVEWEVPFECTSTGKEKFTTRDGVVYVEGMHETLLDADYILEEDVKGIILPYKEYEGSNGEKINLEFIALMPEVDLNEYIDKLTDEELKNVLNYKKSLGANEELRLMLPRFTYDYSITDFIKVLNNIGINSAFTPDAEFRNITEISTYINTAIHKTHIELNETGTKAAAVTFFGFTKSSLPVEKKYIDISFNKPFMYMIKDRESGELLFVGTVYSPNKWQGSTCKSEE